MWIHHSVFASQIRLPPRPLQLQPLPALTYVNFGQQELEELPEALTTMTSLRVKPLPHNNADVVPSHWSCLRSPDCLVACAHSTAGQPLRVRALMRFMARCVAGVRRRVYPGSRGGIGTAGSVSLVVSTR